nr:MAG: hypothetical protein [Caudoviricetes sp.]
MNIYIISDNMFIENKYTKWYFRIIENVKSQNRIKTKNNYYEIHHILPKSLYPKLKKEETNLVYLTAREHFICHWLLTKMILGKEKYKMFKALHKMTQKCSGDRIISSFEYEVARKYNSLYMKENNPTKREDVRRKISISRKGIKATENAKLNMSLSSSRYWKDKDSVLKGAKFYNNGIQQKMFFPNEIPDGWIKGRLNAPWNKGKSFSNHIVKNEENKISKIPYFTLVKTKKTYSKNLLSRHFPEFRKYF